MGCEGAGSRGESLKQNSTLTQLNLEGMSESSEFVFACMWQDQANIFYSGNGIGSEGAQALAESLKQNTTLTQLDLSSMSELSEFMFACMWQDQSNISSYSENGVGFEGAQALAESLKQNTTLTQLDLYSMSELSEFMFACMWQDQSNISSYSDNRINFEGAQALAASLKQNTTLTQLHLSSMSELSEFMFACMWQDQSNTS